MTVYEYVEAHPDATSGDIARATGKKAPAVASALSQLYSTGRVIKSGTRNGAVTYRVNDLPFGCGNELTLMFNQLLREARR